MKTSSFHASSLHTSVDNIPIFESKVDNKGTYPYKQQNLLGPDSLGNLDQWGNGAKRVDAFLDNLMQPVRNTEDSSEEINQITDASTTDIGLIQEKLGELQEQLAAIMPDSLTPLEPVTYLPSVNAAEIAAENREQQESALSSQADSIQPDILPSKIGKQPVQDLPSSTSANTEDGDGHDNKNYNSNKVESRVPAAPMPNHSFLNGNQLASDHSKSLGMKKNKGGDAAEWKNPKDSLSFIFFSGHNDQNEDTKS